MGTNGRKRHLVVGTRGLPLMVMVTPADLHDAAATEEVLFRLPLLHPEHDPVADSAYAGNFLGRGNRHLDLTIKPVSQPKDTSGFVVLPRCWAVEGSLAWMMHARRHAPEYERLIQLCPRQIHVPYAADADGADGFDWRLLPGREAVVGPRPIIPASGAGIAR